MPPIRRYVRISPHSCLEVRIFIDNPTDITTWLLRRPNPALPRVFAAVKPLILPKLKEENERTKMAKGKSGKKKKSVKDIIKGDDFEVVIFLTEGQGRHEIVVKRKEAHDTALSPTEGHGGLQDDPVIIREENDELLDVTMADIPVAVDDEDEEQPIAAKVRGRRGQQGRRQTASNNTGEGEQDYDLLEEEKKKVGFKTRYDGFTIWGKVLYLLVERKGGPIKKDTVGQGKRNMKANSISNSNDDNEGAQQALMQEWITSTQVAQDEDDDG